MPYDAVVVGAGVNGLAAALHLAAKGWKVAVVERARRRRRRGQDPRNHAARLSPRPLRNEFGPVRRLAVFRRPQGSPHRPRPCSSSARSNASRRAFPDGTWLGVEKNLEANASRIAALEPGRRRALARDDGGVRRRTRRTSSACSARRCRPGRRCARSFAAWRARGTELGRRHGASPRRLAARMAGREFRERKAQGHDGGLGHAS